MSKDDWQRIAEQFAGISDARLSRVFPEVVRILLEQGASRVLDFGCGDGRFAAMALQAGVPEAALYDPVERMTSLAAAAVEPWNDQARVITRTDQIEPDAFDAVVWNAVWMCLSSRHDCLESLRQTSRALRKGGLFVASVTHPCFRAHQFTTYRTSFNMDDYHREGQPFEVTMFDGKSEVRFTDYHWSLGEMTRQLRDAGLQLLELMEIPDLDHAPRPRGIPWLILIARK